jgi:hypothetical protein
MLYGSLSASESMTIVVPRRREIVVPKTVERRNARILKELAVTSSKSPTTLPLTTCKYPDCTERAEDRGLCAPHLASYIRWARHRIAP